MKLCLWIAIRQLGVRNAPSSKALLNARPARDIKVFYRPCEALVPPPSRWLQLELSGQGWYRGRRSVTQAPSQLIDFFVFVLSWLPLGGGGTPACRAIRAWLRGAQVGRRLLRATEPAAAHPRRLVSVMIVSFRCDRASHPWTLVGRPCVWFAVRVRCPRSEGDKKG